MNKKDVYNITYDRKDGDMNLTIETGSERINVRTKNIKILNRITALVTVGAVSAVCSGFFVKDEPIEELPSNDSYSSSSYDYDKPVNYEYSNPGLLVETPYVVYDGDSSTELTLTSWVNGFTDSYNYYTSYDPSLKYLGEDCFAAFYYFANYSNTPSKLVKKLVSKGFISKDCVDLTVIIPDDYSTPEDETVFEPVDQNGFNNVVNAIATYNQINNTSHRNMHLDWLSLQQSGGGTLNPNDYSDPSILIQDPSQREIVHNWYVAFVEGYDLTKGSFSTNEKMQAVYRALCPSSKDGDRVSINDLSPSSQFVVRATLANQFKSFMEDYMCENYYDTLVSDSVHYYDKEKLLENNNFVRYEDVEEIPENLVSELRDCITRRDKLDEITIIDTSDGLMRMLGQHISSYDGFLGVEIKSAKTYSKVM